MKILYLMWIDWRWIWQRPQILASELNKIHDVTVAFPRNIINRWKPQKNNSYPQKYRKIFIVPFYDKVFFLQKCMDLLIKWNMRDINNYDALWIGYPIFEKFIPEGYKKKIIYDCMDNHEALSGSSKNRIYINSLEKRLLLRADTIFASSSLLEKKIKAYLKGKADTQIVLVRNGYTAKKIYQPTEGKRKNTYRLGYIGTISEWMDYKAITRSLKVCDNIEYHLLGVVSGNNKIENERVLYEGVIEHDNLYDKICEYDCLVMPFLINDIVLSVDPVKLYEYISFGKCIISCRYPEIERFEKFVYFYNNEEEYCELIQKFILTGFQPKYSKQEQELFMKDNSWSKRVGVIEECLNHLQENYETS